ncbi:Hypothetical protein CGLY_11845 [Corynebacterium glyciniphilum AJ 3170]|uniref:DDE domain-containing protein n=1 Tax=Corynebacterium glyciniphilum AJ 3170 TaxID=1404245 RepID=X5EE01_9CORY|nr:Hypothetical protein CGLY_11845 [Corynebacterium glyciniphilum AJ 3170]
MIEGDHGRLKRILGPKGGGFKKKVSAYRTLRGMEAMHALRKGQGRVFAVGCLNADAVSVAKAFAGACDGLATGLGLPASISFRAPRAPLCNSTVAALLTASPPRIGQLVSSGVMRVG